MKRRYNDLLEKIFGGLSIFKGKTLSGDDIVNKWKYPIISIFSRDAAEAIYNGDEKALLLAKKRIAIAKRLRTVDDLIKYGKALNFSPILIRNFIKVKKIMADNDGLVPERIILSMGI